MKNMLMVGLAIIAGSVLATASMALDVEVDVLATDLQPNVGFHEVVLTPDRAATFVAADVMVDVVPDGLSGSDAVDILTVALTELMTAPGGAAILMASDPLLVWRSRAVDGFAVQPDLLI